MIPPDPENRDTLNAKSVLQTFSYLPSKPFQIMISKNYKTNWIFPNVFESKSACVGVNHIVRWDISDWGWLMRTLDACNTSEGKRSHKTKHEQFVQVCWCEREKTAWKKSSDSLDWLKLFSEIKDFFPLGKSKCVATFPGILKW